MDNLSQTMDTLWSEYEKENSTTDASLTELIKDESKQVMTVIIFVISAILVIILIFMLAIFIDCRQQKIQQSKVKRMKRRTRETLRRAFPSLPTVKETSRNEDQTTIVNNMHTEHAQIV